MINVNLFQTGIIDRDTIKQLMQFIENIQEDYDTLSIIQNENFELHPVNDDLKFLFDSYLSFWRTIHHLFRIDYKDSTFDFLKHNISAEMEKKIGVNLLKRNLSQKPIGSIKITKEISIDYWNQIINFIESQEKFKIVIERLKGIYKKKIEQQIIAELKTVTIPLEEQIKKEYYKAYFKNPISFEEFINLTANKLPSKNQTTSNATLTYETQKVRQEFENALEQKKLEVMKKEQIKSFDNYERYFSLDERELARAKREGSLEKRIFQKKSRREKFK
jgi:hypothetical protein